MNKNNLIIKRYRKSSPDPKYFLRLHRAEYGQKFRSKFDMDRFYPDTYSLIKSLRKTYKLSKKIQTILGHGAEGLIKDILIWRYLKNIKQNVLIYEPNYYMYEHYSKLLNFKIFKYNLKLSNNLNIKSGEIIQALKKNKITLFCMVNPSAPLEKYINKKEVIKILKYCKKNKIFLIIDEVYKSFFDKSFFDLIYKYNFIIVRSLSKTPGYPGIRVGYLLCNQKIFKEIDSLRLSIELSSYSVNKAKKILDNPKKIISDEKKIIEASKFFSKQMSIKGFKSYNKNINSIVIDLKNLILKKKILLSLKKKKILVSSNYKKNLKNCISITTTNVSNLKKILVHFISG